MRTWTALASVSILGLAACGGGATSDDDGVDPPDARPPAATALDTCRTGGPALTSLWSADNHHPMIALVIAPDGTAVVSTPDGYVKQWSLGVSADTAPLPGGRPSYGEPFTAQGVPVSALAIGAGGGEVIGGEDGGAVIGWDLADAHETMHRQLDAQPFTALAATPSSIVVARPVLYGDVKVVPVGGGDPGESLHTMLWHISAMFAPGDSLLLVGDVYGDASVDRHSLAAPLDSVDSFNGLEAEPQLQAPFTTAALSPDGDWLAAGADGFVVIFAAHDLASGPVARMDVAAVTGLAFTATGAGLAVATADGHITLWDRNLVDQRGSIDAPAGPLALDPSGDRLIVASSDSRLRAFACR